MALTIGGFAQARGGVLQGKGGSRGRRDNGVPPLPAELAAAAIDEATEWSVAVAEPLL